MAHKLDIFETLAAIDRHEFDYLEKRSDEERKGFAPPVVLRWASAVADHQNAEMNLLLVNEVANLSFYDLYEHPELQYKLLASCGQGRPLRHQWIPMAARPKGDKVRDFLWQFWPGANRAEIDILLGQFNRDSFIEFVNECGCTPEEAKEVVSAYDRLAGNEEKPKKTGAKSRRR